MGSLLITRAEEETPDDFIYLMNEEVTFKTFSICKVEVEI